MNNTSRHRKQFVNATNRKICLLLYYYYYLYLLYFVERYIVDLNYYKTVLLMSAVFVNNTIKLITNRRYS